MKYLIFAALLAISACASAETQAGAQPTQTTASSQSAPNYDDARSNASDAEVRDARRAYRAACQQSRSDGYCECMTGGMAQALSPADLTIATAEFSGRAIQASDQTRQHVASVRREVDQGCAQFR